MWAGGGRGGRQGGAQGCGQGWAGVGKVASRGCMKYPLPCVHEVPISCLACIALNTDRCKHSLAVWSVDKGTAAELLPAAAKKKTQGWSGKGGAEQAWQQLDRG